MATTTMQTAFRQMVAALKVVTLDPVLRTALAVKDRMALKQCETALAAADDVVTLDVSLVQIGQATTPVNPLDALTLTEAYGAQAVEAMRDGCEVRAVAEAVRAAHWARVFTSIDDSYERTYREEELRRENLRYRAELCAFIDRMAYGKDDPIPCRYGHPDCSLPNTGYRCCDEAQSIAERICPACGTRHAQYDAAAELFRCTTCREAWSSDEV